MAKKLSRRGRHTLLPIVGDILVELRLSSAGEAWHFQYPRPGRPVGGKMKQVVALTGAPGRLL